MESLSTSRMAALIVLILGSGLIGFLFGKGYGEKNMAAQIEAAEKASAEAALEEARQAANPFSANPLGEAVNPFEKVKVNPFE